jgi:hypothetical protein
LSSEAAFRKNHYVPVWLQKRFLRGSGPNSFSRLDLNPDTYMDSLGNKKIGNSIRVLGPEKMFREFDLYTTKFGSEFSTEIEEKFFGEIDRLAPETFDYFEEFSHPKYKNHHFQNLLRTVSIQKLRTPKGLMALAEFQPANNWNELLFALQKLQNLYCAHWTEAVWAVVKSAPETPGFLLSDHPVTTYNQAFFPGSPLCAGHRDPEIWRNGTFTIVPLSRKTALIFTNVSWIRNPHGDPKKLRPNPSPFRTAMFDWRGIQTGRTLTRTETLEINYIIKTRASRYVASYDENWLYPERELSSTHWSRFGKSYLLMPDPRA